MQQREPPGRWRRARPQGEADLLWKAVRRLWAAVAIALFPVLFIIDEATDTAFSPVLPGLVVLVLLWALVPYGHYELLGRRKTDLDAAQRHEMRAKYLLGTAAVWCLLWVVLA